MIRSYWFLGTFVGLLIGVPTAIGADVPTGRDRAESDTNSELPISADELMPRARAVLAQLDGAIRVAGLAAPVDVLRDQWGVPHIFAKNQHDLFFAQGFVAAQDRLFQIDMWRRVAAGETAEVLGHQSLALDRFARLARYRGDIEAEWASYAPDTRQIVTAFTEGINAYIDHIGRRLPIEFQILDYRPKKWMPQDCLGRTSVQPVALNLKREVARAELVATIGLEAARQIAPTDPRVDFAPSADLDLAGINAEVLAGYNAVMAPLAFAGDKESNNWAIDATLSMSGKPMLASDPHRTIALPSLRYLVHLNAPGWNVIGSGEPALPGVAIGHNDHVAWGFTVVTTDQADLVVEQLNADDLTQYKVGDRWEPVKVIHENVSVRSGDGMEQVELALRYTRNGPIIHEDHERHRAYALRWVGSEPGTAAYLASLSLDRARGAREFLQAAAHRWKTPSENLVFADVDGNIGWIAAALTPVRSGWHGLLPVPGGSGQYYWKRFLASDELPQALNPASHYVITSNQNILPAGYPHAISFEWAENFRHRRLKQLLEATPRFSLVDFQHMQYDRVSLAARQLLDILRDASIDDSRLEPYLKLLLGWDGELGKQSAPGALAAVWWRELEQAFFGLKVPEHLIEFATERNGPHVMLAELANPSEAWFGQDPAAARNELVRQTLASAVDHTRQKLGEDVSLWELGRLQHVLFEHPLAALDPMYGKAFNVGPFPSGSGPHAPDQARYRDDFSRRHGATYRQVFDLADWDRGLATSAPGQSGQPGSEHYADLTPLWDRGEYFPLAFSRAKVEQVTRHRLTLIPAN